MKAYDPNVAPEPRAWLARNEATRIDLVVRYHHREGLKGSAGRMHSIVHVLVENQLAMNERAVVETLARLRSQGHLSRHEALHAIGSVLAEQIYHLVKEQTPDTNVNAVYAERLKYLNAESWKNAG